MNNKIFGNGGLYFVVVVLHLLFFTKCNQNDNTSNGNVTTSRKKYIRKNANSPAAEKDLKALAKALDIMRKKDCSDPLSWYYQGAMHWIPDTINQKNKLCNSYQTFVDKKDGWDNCTHTESGEEEIHFLTWHRMYIYHFEKIVRKLSGYSSFALPYWGYTNADDTVLNRTMPEIFRTKSSGLYEIARLDSLNKGIPISGKTSRRLGLKKLNKYSFYYLYNKNVNNVPHGLMHNYIGYGNDVDSSKLVYNQVWQKNTYGMMSEVATAAFDAIFWVHHSNIDRIWQQWTNSSKGNEVLLEELKDVEWNYVFFDENGNKVTYSVEDVIKILYNLDYEYDDTKVYEKKSGLQEKKIFSPKHITQDKLLVQHKKQELLNGPVNQVKIPTVKNQVDFLLDKNNEDSVFIVIIKTSFTKATKGDYEVYINLPAEEHANPESDYYLGVMNFFGADHKHNHSIHKQHSQSVSNKVRGSKTFYFEVDNKVIKSIAHNKEQFKIDILKFNGNEADDVRLDDITIVRY